MKSKHDVVNEILKSKKYGNINQSFISGIVDDLYDNYKSDKLLIKEVKNKLHQMHEIFLDADSSKKTRTLLEEEKYDDILKMHMSSLERFSFYKEFYEKIFSITGIPESILDLACGYNPFSIMYMNLNEGFSYYAYDINEETSDVLNMFFKKKKFSAIYKTLDLSRDIPSESVDVTFIFKLLPLIERQNKLFSKRLLEKLNTKYIVVTFPTKTVTGKNIGMIDNYREMFSNIINDSFIILREIVFENELVFIITNNDKKV